MDGCQCCSRRDGCRFLRLDTWRRIQGSDPPLHPRDSDFDVSMIKALWPAHFLRFCLSNIFQWKLDIGANFWTDANNLDRRLIPWCASFSSFHNYGGASSGQLGPVKCLIFPVK